MIEKIKEYITSNKDLTGSMVSFLLKPENLKRLKNNKKLVKQLTKIKALPSSVRLYLRNLAGVTDPITEDFFSKSELKEIKKRVSEAKAHKSMGEIALSGLTSAHKDNIIGYQLEKGKLSLNKAFTDEATNIDMTLGQASFSTDKDGNVIVKDTHNFSGVEGGGYKGKSLKKRTFEQVVPHPYEEDSILNKLLKGVDVGRVSTVEESDKQFLKRAKKALDVGDIDPAHYARIVAGMQQGDGIPIEINIGNITHEDKLEANPNFAEYIAYDTDNVGLPTLIRNQARKYLR